VTESVEAGEPNIWEINEQCLWFSRVIKNSLIKTDKAFFFLFKEVDCTSLEKENAWEEYLQTMSE